MSKKINKDNGDLVLGQVDDYIIQKDIKNKLENLMKTVNPENHYNWEHNLRNDEKENIMGPTSRPNSIRNWCRRTFWCFCINF